MSPAQNVMVPKPVAGATQVAEALVTVAGAEEVDLWVSPILQAAPICCWFVEPAGRVSLNVVGQAEVVHSRLAEEKQAAGMAVSAPENGAQT